MDRPQFRERKATEAAAWFLREHGGEMDLIKLLKLVYLADRTALLRHGRPITFDSFFSLDHGPIPSNVYDILKGVPRYVNGGEIWYQYISERDAEDYSVSLKRDPGRAHLSDAEVRVLEGVDGKFGGIPPFELVELLHDELPEWEDPDGSHKEISYEQILRVGGWDDDAIQELVADLVLLKESEKVIGPGAA